MFEKFDVMGSKFLFESSDFNPHCVKSVLTWSSSSPHFPAFGLNTERCSDHKNSEYGLFYAVRFMRNNEKWPNIL